MNKTIIWISIIAFVVIAFYIISDARSTYDGQKAEEKNISFWKSLITF